MNNVSICVRKELSIPDNTEMLAAVEEQLFLDLGRSINVTMSELDLAQPDATATLSDFGNIGPEKAREVMTDTAMIMRRFLPLKGKKVSVTMNVTLVLNA